MDLPYVEEVEFAVIALGEMWRPWLNSKIRASDWHCVPRMKTFSLTTWQTVYVGLTPTLDAAHTALVDAPGELHVVGAS